MTQTAGKVDLKPESRIVRDPDGRVTRIDSCVDDAKAPEDWLRQYHVVRALIRLVIDARQQRQVPRTFGSAVEVSMGYGIGSERIHSLDPKRWKPFGEAR